jgi:MFS family permease
VAIVQGLSVGAGMVVGRAMIRDLFDSEDAQRLMSLVTLFFGLAPAIAPVIGGGSSWASAGARSSGFSPRWASGWSR